jgi:hypothetical protein
MVLNGISILIIGASHLTIPGALVTTLNDGLLNKGAQVHSIGVCGTSPSQWTVVAKGTCGGADRVNSGPINLKIASKALTTPISELIKVEKPNLLMIVLGDTLAEYSNAESLSLLWVGAELAQMNRAVALSKVRCVWIGPSWGEEGFPSRKTFARVSQVSDLIEKRVGSCTYINSLKMSKPGEWLTMDGIHYRNQYYQQWGSKIVEVLEKLP